MGLFLPGTLEQPLPIVMYLHACQNDPVYSSFWIISAANAIEPCAVFLPTALPSIDHTCADWGGTYDTGLRPNMVDALHELDSLIDVYGFDTDRCYLYGESMGGEGVYRLLTDFPGRFAGGVTAAGYTINKGADKMARTPLWIFHGENDAISSVDNARTIYQSILDAGGIDVKYTEYPGLDHVPGLEAARSEPGLFEWLLAGSRSTLTRYFPEKKTGHRNAAVKMSCSTTGNLLCTAPLPAGSILTLYHLNGRMVFRATVGGTIIKLPSGIPDGGMLWRIMHPAFRYSGKITFNR